MAKSKDKKKHLSNAELREIGAVGFTMDDVRKIQEEQKDSVNAKAYEYMVEAMAVSANYMNDTITDEGVRMDDVYPTTYEETMKMDELLDKSERAVKDDNDEEYNKMIVDLRGIVGWSRRRHFNFSWGIILGTIITVVAVMYWSNSDKETKAHRKAQYELVKAWELPGDETGINYQKMMDTIEYNDQFKGAAEYKAYKMKSKAESIKSQQEYAAKYRAQADTASTKEAQKKYLGWAKENDKNVEKYQKQLEEIQGWDLKDSKKEAVKQQKRWYRSASKAAAFSYCLMIFFLLLIPLYIFANHSWGYVITRTRAEQELLDKIKRWGYSIAAGLFGAAAAMEATTEYRVHWSDGSTTHESETNWGIVAIKVMLLIAALAIVAVVSTGIMIYSTIVGLKRNYDWKAIYAAAKNKAVAAKDLAQDVAAKAKK